MKWRSAAVVSVVSAVVLWAAADPVYDAMQAELKRSMNLSLKQLEKPYFISYAIDDGKTWTATAAHGGLLSAHVRKVPDVRRCRFGWAITISTIRMAAGDAGAAGLHMT